MKILDEKTLFDILAIQGLAQNETINKTVSEFQETVITALNTSKFKIDKANIVETVPAPRVVSCKASGRESVMETVVVGF